jgi:hypothetical protein
MISYDYLVVPLFAVEPLSDDLLLIILEDYGIQGWQLVVITATGQAIFMRPIQ